VARGPKDAQIEHIAADAEQRELVMRRADVDSLGPRRYVERHIGPLVDAEAESAKEGQLDRVSDLRAAMTSPRPVGPSSTAWA